MLKAVLTCIALQLASSLVVAADMPVAPNGIDLGSPIGETSVNAIFVVHH